MVELNIEDHGAFKDQHTQGACTQEENKGRLDNRRDGQFAYMKTRGSGDIHIQITVVDLVETPQKRHLMVEEVPNVQHEIHKDHGGQDLDPGWGLNQIQDPDFVGLHEGDRAENHR